MCKSSIVYKPCLSFTLSLRISLLKMLFAVMVVVLYNCWRCTFRISGEMCQTSLAIYYRKIARNWLERRRNKNAVERKNGKKYLHQRFNENGNCLLTFRLDVYLSLLPVFNVMTKSFLCVCTCACVRIAWNCLYELNPFGIRSSIPHSTAFLLLIPMMIVLSWTARKKVG